MKHLVSLQVLNHFGITRLLNRCHNRVVELCRLITLFLFFDYGRLLLLLLLISSCNLLILSIVSVYIVGNILRCHDVNLQNLLALHRKPRGNLVTARLLAYLFIQLLIFDKLVELEGIFRRAIFGLLGLLLSKVESALCSRSENLHSALCIAITERGIRAYYNCLLAEALERLSWLL